MKPLARAAHTAHWHLGPPDWPRLGLYIHGLYIHGQYLRLRLHHLLPEGRP